MAALTVSTSQLPPGYAGQVYEASFACSGTIAAHAFTLSAGTTQTGKQALPASLSYGADGRITGTPLATDVGVYNLSIKITDGTNTTDNMAYTLKILSADAYLASHGYYTSLPDSSVTVAEQIANLDL